MLRLAALFVVLLAASPVPAQGRKYDPGRFPIETKLPKDCAEDFHFGKVLDLKADDVLPLIEGAGWRLSKEQGVPNVRAFRRDGARDRLWLDFRKGRVVGGTLQIKPHLAHEASSADPLRLVGFEPKTFRKVDDNLDSETWRRDADGVTIVASRETATGGRRVWSQFHVRLD